ncbi:[FeFe] hydrogenase H-cluster radical SAM maturase HydG [Cetobacterium sp.]|uniref:[FeFe] hydrogenase H-cluster radical SAM maturase HydG n=1 Tax=Cetobacterium sp. TaxID=2071632 RepID=UPI0025CE947E|nr:[FeFe] hydrogenase H-cluster radical SAM maturase HydG [uncultured Cetobacterium sp.]
MEKEINFINQEYIENLLKKSKNSSYEEIERVLNKAKNKEGLTHDEVASLLEIKDEKQKRELYEIAGELKKSIYGNRIVVFAPLYVSDYCVNNCTYCGYKRDNKFERKKLSREQIQNEVRLLEKMGHKRLALELGEDPVNVPIEYTLDAIDAVYSTKFENGSIRRINVNIAATTVENYKKLKDAEIGTYILFQETYHKPTYERVHPKSLKGNYEYHLTAFNRAMEAGIDDVGAGVLFGLADYKYEIIALMLHNEYLEKEYGVGFHTISVPRIKKAEGMSLEEYPHQIDDDTFRNIVAIIRLAVPFTGMILSTRETAELRRELIKYGISQISAGSSADVGGYTDREEGKTRTQFELADHRTPLEVLKELLEQDCIPSYCTACYRMGRTGDRFMQLAKSGNIQNVCSPNALLTLMEYAMDYGDDELTEKVEEVIERELQNIVRDDIKKLTIEKLEKIKNGERDLYL